MIPAAPVDAVGLEGVAAVGHEQRQPPAGFQHAHDLADRRAVVLHVLQHLVAEHQVKMVGVGRAGALRRRRRSARERLRQACWARSKSISSPSHLLALRGQVRQVHRPRRSRPPAPDPAARSPAARRIIARRRSCPARQTYEGSPRRAAFSMLAIGHGRDYILREIWYYARIRLTVGPILLTPRSGQPPLFCLYKD